VTPLDRIIRDLRIRKALPHIPDGARLLDVGCADGSLFRALRGRVSDAVGIDPDAVPVAGTVKIVRGRFPDDLGAPAPFDVITMLAVFEHFSDAERPRVVEACRRLLRPGGRVVLTVPAPAVDHILALGRRVGLLHGMDADAHHAYRPESTPGLFSSFRVLRHEPFELGLNHLYVLER
jgi:2-polyprenyl-3-methyl-5-hydroxy-6-metoxy-1,4-benzoquinol methylase